MNKTLEEVVQELAALPDAEQERLAEWIRAELEDERLWDAQFKSSLPRLRKLAERALERKRRG